MVPEINSRAWRQQRTSRLSRHVFALAHPTIILCLAALLSAVRTIYFWNNPVLQQLHFWDLYLVCPYLADYVFTTNLIICMVERYCTFLESGSTLFIPSSRRYVYLVLSDYLGYHYSLDRLALTLRRLMSYIYIYMEHPFLMFLHHTQRRNTVGRTPLDEWSTRRRDLYLTTHDTHNRQISMPPVAFEPKISAGERPCRAPAEILGSNPTGGMDICLLWVSCVVR